MRLVKVYRGTQGILILKFSTSNESVVYSLKISHKSEPPRVLASNFRFQTEKERLKNLLRINL